MKLQTKLIIILVFVFLTLFTTVEYLHYLSEKNEVINELRRDARNIRSVLMATRRVYHHQFLDSGIPLSDKTLGFLPAYALSRISNDFRNWSKSNIYFNNVSDRPRNPNNAADSLEKEAMSFFLKNPSEKERFVPFKSEEDELFYHFSTPIWVEKYCLECHGKREDAHVTIRARYVSAFDYKVGELRGIMSIKLPITKLQAIVWANFKGDLWIHGVSFSAMFLLISWLLRRHITTPMVRLTKGLNEVADGRYDQSIKGLSGEMAIVGNTFNQMSKRLKQRENELQASLKEKEVLLKEVHHRVKNNMQVISSLLKLQAGNQKDEKLIEILKESQSRIKAMSLIHEKLYRSENIANIDFDDYIRNLTNDLFRFYSISTAKVVLKRDICDVFLNIDTAIPCGLIINEFVSNSLKYAFPFDSAKDKPFDSAQDRPDNIKGEIKISLHKIEESRSRAGVEFELILSDNGKGIPEDIDYRNTESLGLRLIYNLTEHQLGGKIELDRSKGTEFRICFKEVKYKERI